MRPFFMIVLDNSGAARRRHYILAYLFCTYTAHFWRIPRFYRIIFPNLFGHSAVVHVQIPASAPSNLFI